MTVLSVEKALLILEYLAAHGGEASLTDVCRALGLHASTAHHLTATLRERGFVEQDPKTKRYFLSLLAFEVGQAVRSHQDLKVRAMPHLRRLALESAEDANLAVLDKDQVVYIAQAESDRMMRMFTRPGARAPLHATGVGKCLVAWMPHEEQERLIRRLSFTPCTLHTVRTPDELIRQLADVRESGFALDREEREDGVVCIAAPVRHPQQHVIAAISISGPAARVLGGRYQHVVDAVKAAAAQVSESLALRLPLADSSDGEARQ